MGKIRSDTVIVHIFCFDKGPGEAKLAHLPFFFLSSKKAILSSFFFSPFSSKSSILQKQLSEEGKEVKGKWEGESVITATAVGRTPSSAQKAGTNTTFQPTEQTFARDQTSKYWRDLENCLNAMKDQPHKRHGEWKASASGSLWTHEQKSRVMVHDCKVGRWVSTETDGLCPISETLKMILQDAYNGCRLWEDRYF